MKKKVFFAVYRKKVFFADSNPIWANQALMNPYPS